MLKRKNGKDYATMTTEELIKMHPSALAGTLQKLDAKTCENHARKILKMLEGPTFESYLELMVGISVVDAETGKKDIMPYYQQTKKLFPNVSSDNDILGRLVSVTLMMITLRLEKSRKNMH